MSTANRIYLAHLALVATVLSLGGVGVSTGDSTWVYAALATGGLMVAAFYASEACRGVRR